MTRLIFSPSSSDAGAPGAPEIRGPSSSTLDAVAVGASPPRHPRFAAGSPGAALMRGPEDYGLSFGTTQ
jgi:hypothetical protein